MSAISKNEAEKLSASYSAWWRDAGVEAFVAPESKNWLESPTKPIQPLAEKPTSERLSEPRRGVDPAPESVPQLIVRDDWPADISALTKMLAKKAALPGNQYGGNSAVPLPNLAPKVMLIGDFPDAHDIENCNFSGGPSGKLMQRMMHAIGIAPDEFLFTAMATTRPATGALPESDFTALAEFMTHQIGLFKPEKLIIFGSAACQALLGADMMDMRGSLHYFNHNVQKAAAVTTFHPRTLLARPQMKRQAWKDLQVLIK